MKHILCFGDSNTWGRVPGEPERFSWNERWTGVLQTALGAGYRIIEEGLRGRTSAFDDALRPGRNGAQILPLLLETHSPLDLIVVMLGTNDLKSHLNLNAEQSSQGISSLLNIISQSDSAKSQVLLIAPPRIVPTPDTEMARLFQGGPKKSEELSWHLRTLAERSGVNFLDAGLVVCSDPKDGIHWSKYSQQIFGRYLARWIRNRFGESTLPQPLPITEGVRRRIAKLFAEEDRKRIEQMLSEDCGNSLPLLQDATAQDLERYQCAALKLSGGKIGELERAIRVAKEDWRDLLVAAGFGNDPLEHTRWLMEHE